MGGKMSKEYYKKYNAERRDKNERKVQARAAYAASEEVRLRQKFASIKSLYGLSREEYYALIEAQKGCCAICAQPLSPGRHTHIDHCHATNKVRGILCQWCNPKLGWVEKVGPESIINYLKQSL